jgi:hypothetical protein
LTRVKWSTAVDIAPGGGAHYGTPMLTRNNTVVFPVRQASGAFVMNGRRASDGTVIWTLATGYVPPSSGWVPACGSSLLPNGQVAIPDSGGRVLVRASGDDATSTTRELVFYGAANYNANPSAYNTNVKINTPITVDRAGNMYFGFTAATNPINLHSGIARITAAGVGSWIAATTAANDATVSRVPHNAAPALSLDGTQLYVPVRFSGSGGYLLALDSTTLAMVHRVRLIDPQTLGAADLSEFSTASPTIAPDGQVFYGILDGTLANNDRGWMLHFNADLSQTMVPGAFGWDNTCSLIPASSVPSYSGPSTYLLLSKYNNYYGVGTGDGLNKMAVLDPASSQTDPITGVTILREVMTMLGPTHDPAGGANSVREWCVNNAAVDAAGHCGIINNEDGKLYKWNFDTNTLAQILTLTGGTSEAYTPTIIGPDGSLYAINAATLFAVGQ